MAESARLDQPTKERNMDWTDPYVLSGAFVMLVATIIVGIGIVDVLRNNVDDR